MAVVLVIGYGNPLRADDGVGWHAAEALARMIPEAEAQVWACHQLTPELAEPLSRASAAIFIDAGDGPPPGSLEWQPLSPDSEPTGAFTHHVTPEALLACAQRLYGACPTAEIFTVAGASFDYGEELTPRVQATFPALLERVCTAVQAHLGAEEG